MEEYRIRVPHNQIPAFERGLAEVGAEVIASKISTDPRDHGEKMALYLGEHRQRVASLLEPKDPEVEARITHGYEKMLKEALVVVRTEVLVINTGEITELKRAVVNIFLECTRKEPKTITRGEVIYASWGDNSTLSPREVRVLIQRYGLSGGQTRKFKEIGEELEVSPSRPRVINEKSLRKLRHPRNKRQLSPFYTIEEPIDF